ncbi:hypothetical protein D3C72_2153240 [compost metagenome]
MHVFQLLVRNGLRRLFQLNLQLFQTQLQALLLGRVGCEHAGLQTGDAALVIQHQQGFRQIEAEVRAALILTQCRQVFEASDQVVSKQATKHDGFTFVGGRIHQC